MPASSRACWTMSRMTWRWCSEVSRGRKPVPGGGDVGFAGVAEDVAGVRHDADRHLVRGAFEAHRELNPGGLYVSLAAAAHRACVCEGEARQ